MYDFIRKTMQIKKNPLEYPTESEWIINKM